MNTDKLHEQVWRRFIRRPFGHVLNYADAQGRTTIPTPEEYQNCIPNAYGWTTPNSDGAFFTGLYLYGLCEKYDFAPGEQLLREIRLLADGLLLLCDVGRVDGFIARGVADDGISHYPVGSEDQFGPWLLGLWRLLRSPASDEALREKILPRLVRSLRGVRSAGWNIPTEWEGVTRGSYAHKDWRGAAKLLFTAAVAREVGVIDETEFQQLVSEKPDGGLYTRPEIVSHGFAPDMIRSTGLIQFWIDVCAQICAGRMIELDPPHADCYRAGIAANGVAVTEFLRDFEEYNRIKGTPFNMNWRELLPGRQLWNTPEEATAEGSRQNAEFFAKVNPALRDERVVLGQALFGGWIGVLSGEEVSAGYAYSCLCEAAEAVDWEGLSMSYAFAVESAICCYENSLRQKA